MKETQKFKELTETMRPQDPHGDGTGLRFETGEHGGDYPDNMPQAITVTDAQGRCAAYVPLRICGKIVVPQTARRLGGGGLSPDSCRSGRISATVAVGTEIAPRPPHRSVRAAFPHTAPTSGE
jgi:hypothetical protein